MAALGGGGGGAPPLYTPPLCFSPPIRVDITGLHLSTDVGIQFSILFANQDLNARLLLPLQFGLTWA
jgi:hypothetical protein